MALQPALFSSASGEWETPRDLFARLDREFSFTLDVCATSRNRKCPAYFTRTKDGLAQRWTGTCWMNPPYGRAIGAWMKKAFNESLNGAKVVCLLPARTDTTWWHDWVLKAQEIRLLRGRVRFVGAASPAPFPSAVAIFGRRRSKVSQQIVGWNWRNAVDRGISRLQNESLRNAPLHSSSQMENSHASNLSPFNRDDHDSAGVERAENVG